MLFSTRPASWQTASRSHRRPAAPQRGDTRLQLEQLEERTLPSFGFGWAFHIGGSNDDAGLGIATDSQGNVYVSGDFCGTNVNFAPLNSTRYYLSTLPGDSADAFAASYSSSGALRWATVLGSSVEITGGDITVQSSSSIVYVAYRGSSSTNVAKLEATGGYLDWNVSIPGSNSTSPAVAVGPVTGDVYVTGATTSSQAFVAQLNPSGVLQWTQTSSGGTAAGSGVAVYDANGSESAYLTGNYTGTVNFGGRTLTSLSGSQDIFVWELNADSTTVKATSMGTSTGGTSDGITVDGVGNVYLTGEGGYGLSNQILVAKLTPALAMSWTKFFSGNRKSAGSGYAVAVDSAGNVYTTGEFEGTFDFDPGPGTYTIQSGQRGIGNDVFVSELDSSGNFVAAADFHDMDTDGFWNGGGNGIAVDNANPPNVYTTGTFHGTKDFDPTAGTHLLTSNGGRDAFVSKLTQAQTSAALTTPGGTPRAGMLGLDEALALQFLPGHAPGTAFSVSRLSSQEPIQSQRVPQALLGTDTQNGCLPSVLPHATAALDKFFADFVNDGLSDILAAEALPAPPA